MPLVEGLLIPPTLSAVDRWRECADVLGETVAEGNQRRGIASFGSRIAQGFGNASRRERDHCEPVDADIWPAQSEQSRALHKGGRAEEIGGSCTGRCGASGGQRTNVILTACVTTGP